jgi:hypothetical protein
VVGDCQLVLVYRYCNTGYSDRFDPGQMFKRTRKYIVTYTVHTYMCTYIKHTCTHVHVYIHVYTHLEVPHIPVCCMYVLFVYVHAY